MFATILTILWLAIILFLLSAVARKYFDKSSKYSFQSWEKSDLPFITIDVQGCPLNMITDSAAAVSVIRRESLEKLTYELSSRRIHLSSVTTDGINSEVVTIPININGKEVKTDFVVYNEDDIADFRRHGIVIDGILGVEFFKRTGGVVDFNTKTVKFP